MNFLSEKEALGKWCLHRIHFRSIDQARPRFIDEDDENCIGSKCMKWCPLGKDGIGYCGIGNKS